MGGGNSDNGFGIAVDGSGNVYTTGTFQGTADFDPGADAANLTSSGGIDIFVSKLDSNGIFVWAKRIGGSSSDTRRSIAVDSSDNVYITGNFEGTVDFDPGIGVSNVFDLTSSGSRDVFVSKLDSDGGFVWAKTMGGTSFDVGIGIAVDGSGVYTTGAFEDTADFDPGVNDFNLTSSGRQDIFVSKLGTDGNFLWAKSFIGGADPDQGFWIAVDGNGKVYTTGEFQGTVDFDPGDDAFELTSSGFTDVFVSKLDDSGNFVWARSMGGSSFDEGRSIAVDGSGNVHTTGVFQQTVDFDPGDGAFELTSGGFTDVFVSKLDDSGNFVWAKSMGGTSFEGAFGIAVDGSGNVHTTGRFERTVDFDPGVGIFNLSARGTDIFVSKLGITPPVQVEIDIKPGSDPNCFNNNGNGVIPVAILTNSGADGDAFDFGAATVDPFTLALDGAGVRVNGKKSIEVSRGNIRLSTHRRRILVDRAELLKHPDGRIQDLVGRLPED